MPVPPSGKSSSGNIATVTNNVTKAQVVTTTKPITTTASSTAPQSSSPTQTSSTNCNKNSLNFDSNNGTQNGTYDSKRDGNIEGNKNVSIVTGAKSTGSITTATNTKSEVRCKLYKIISRTENTSISILCRGFYSSLLICYF